MLAAVKRGLAFDHTVAGLALTCYLCLSSGGHDADHAGSVHREILTLASARSDMVFLMIPIRWTGLLIDTAIRGEEGNLFITPGAYDPACDGARRQSRWPSLCVWTCSLSMQAGSKRGGDYIRWPLGHAPKGLDCDALGLLFCYASGVTPGVASRRTVIGLQVAIRCWRARF